MIQPVDKGFVCSVLMAFYCGIAHYRPRPPPHQPDRRVLLLGYHLKVYLMSSAAAFCISTL
jgi:hypothetical protein